MTETYETIDPCSAHSSFDMKSLKKFFECESIYESIKPLHKLSKIFGLSCFNIDSKTKNAQFGLSSVLLILLWISVWIAVTLSSYHDVSFGTSGSTLYTNRKFMAVTYSVVSVASPFLMLCTVVLRNYRRKNISRFLKKIYIFDETLKKLGCEVQPSHSKIYVLFVVLVGFILIGIRLYFVAIFGVQKGFSLIYVGVVLDVPLTVLQLCQLALGSHCVASRMTMLILNFKLLKDKQPYQCFARTSHKDKAFLKHISKLHFTLVDAIDEVNSAFTIEFVLFLLNFFINATSFIYVVIEAIGIESTGPEAKNIFSLVSMLIYLSPVLFVLSTGSKIVQKVNS